MRDPAQAGQDDGLCPLRRIDSNPVMKYTVYVLKDIAGKRYTGYTSDLDRRLWQHNNGVTKSTKNGQYWKVIYIKEFEEKTEAIKYEKFLKTGKGREFINKHCGIV